MSAKSGSHGSTSKASPDASSACRTTASMSMSTTAVTVGGAHRPPTARPGLRPGARLPRRGSPGRPSSASSSRRARPAARPPATMAAMSCCRKSDHPNTCRSTSAAAMAKARPSHGTQKTSSPFARRCRRAGQPEPTDIAAPSAGMRRANRQRRCPVVGPSHRHLGRCWSAVGSGGRYWLRLSTAPCGSSTVPCGCSRCGRVA